MPKTKFTAQGDLAPSDFAPKRKSGESETAYKKRYYTAQRQTAEKMGAAGSDTAQAEVRKIYGKLGKTPPQKAAGTGTGRVDEAALGLLPFVADPMAMVGRGLLERFGARAASDAAGSAARKMLSGGVGKKAAQAVGRNIERSAPRSTARVVGKAKVEPAQSRSLTAQKALPKAPGRVARASRRSPRQRVFSKEELADMKNTTPSEARKIMAKSRATEPKYTRTTQKPSVRSKPKPATAKAAARTGPVMPPRASKKGKPHGKKGK